MLAANAACCTLTVSSVCHHSHFISFDDVGLDARDTILHGAPALEVVHLAGEAEHGADFVDERDGQELDKEDHVAPPWDGDLGLFLADSIDDARDDLLWAQNVHGEGVFGAVEHTRVDVVGADARGFDIAVVPSFLELKSQRFIDGDCAPFTGAIVGQTWDTG